MIVISPDYLGSGYYCISPTDEKIVVGIFFILIIKIRVKPGKLEEIVKD